MDSCYGNYMYMTLRFFIGNNPVGKQLFSERKLVLSSKILDKITKVDFHFTFLTIIIRKKITVSDK